MDYLTNVANLLQKCVWAKPKRAIINAIWCLMTVIGISAFYWLFDLCWGLIIERM